MRMSEDIDFKIKIKNPEQVIAKTQFLKQLKKFRALIITTISSHDFNIKDIVARNEGRYLKVELNYHSVFPINMTLRSHILLEFTVADVCLETDDLRIRTLIEENFDIEAISGSLLTPCVSCEETAIEKWVGLTRRIMAIERGHYQEDPTLVRHIYDLNAINKNNRINDSFFNLALTVIIKDAKQFKNQHPEYAANPGTEITHSIEILKNKPIWESRYRQFIETMVYDRVSPPDYKSGIQTLENISSKVIESLELATL